MRQGGTFCGRGCYLQGNLQEKVMRRLWLLSLLAVPLIAGATASVPAPAQAQDVFGLMRAPMRLMHNLGLRGRLFHRRARTHHAAVTPGPDPRATASAAAATPQTQTDRRTGPGYWPEGFDDLFGFVFAPGTGESAELTLMRERADSIRMYRDAMRSDADPSSESTSETPGG